jgi:hypothetical protein
MENSLPTNTNNQTIIGLVNFNSKLFPEMQIKNIDPEK